MIFDLKNCLAPFSPEELAAVEISLGRQLPASLLALLRQCNGGNPTRSIYRSGSNKYYMQYIVPISSWKEPNLRAEIESSSYLTKVNLVPFGYEGRGAILAVSERDASVHFCDREGIDVTIAKDIRSLFDNLESGASDNSEPISTRDQRMNAVVASVDREVLARYLLDGGLINAVNSDGLTLAQLCAIKGNATMLMEVARAGASLDGAMHYSARFNRRTIIDLLIQQGRSVLEVDVSGRTAIDYVKGNPPLRKYLLEIASHENTSPR